MSQRAELAVALDPPSPSPAPFDRERAALLRRVVDGLDAASLHWLSGYAAGLAEARALGAPPAAAVRAEPVGRATVLYGSQTGNSRRLAERLAATLEQAGLAARVLATGDYPLRELGSEKLLYIVISTQGDGDPPDDARGFVEFLLGKRAPRLPQLAYAVLGLGDSSYPKFCETGRQLDERLSGLGAQRLLDRADCDVDVESIAVPWLETALGKARERLGSAQPAASVTPLRAVAGRAEYGREHPWQAEILLNQRITARESTQDVRHVELSLAGSGLAYEPGDALAVWPTNPASTVNAIVAALGAEPEAPVSVDGRELPLWQWLAAEREVTRLSRPLIAAHAERAGSDELRAFLAPAGTQGLRLALKDWQVIDLLERYPATWSPRELVAALRPLAPRAYSIASSPRVVGEEAHVTVAVVDYLHSGQRRHGAASSYIAGAGLEGQRLPVFIERNDRFRLPADGTRDIIMIGPGTGVAPFRGFVQDRVAAGATGRNWLFFGARHFDTEFLYQLEWQEALRKGWLHRLDLAFSRDQADKVYVQHRLHEAGREVFDWLDHGASLYVCGDASAMAPDVDAVLAEIVSAHGGRSREAAAEYVRDLMSEHRYLRDVY